MNAIATQVPQPLPGVEQPKPRPTLDWSGKLAKLSVEVVLRDKVTELSGDLFATQILTTKTPPVAITGPDAFRKLDATSFTDAVSAASKLALPAAVALVEQGAESSLRDPSTSFAGTAVALMQAADGAYYVSGLALQVMDGRITSVPTIDTGNANFRVTDVQSLNPALKAIVGPHSWVNFTDEQITPALAQA